MMAKNIAITEAFKSLLEVEETFGLVRNLDENFFGEWRSPELADQSINEHDRSELALMWRRLLYQRSAGELLEGAVMLLLASPLLGLAGFYDPPFRLRAEAAVDLVIDDGEELFRGRIDALVLQRQLWVMVLEAKKTAISVRSALPQALAYMMASPQKNSPAYGVLTNGDELVFVKLVPGETPMYGLSRSFSLYTVIDELAAALQVLKLLGRLAIEGGDRVG